MKLIEPKQSEIDRYNKGGKPGRKKYCYSYADYLLKSDYRPETKEYWLANIQTPYETII